MPPSRVRLTTYQAFARCQAGPSSYRLRAAAPPSGSSRVRAALTVEVEVARRALLEPQSVMVRRVLEEVGRLLEHVIPFRRFRHWPLELFVCLDLILGRLLLKGRRSRGRRWRRRCRCGRGLVGLEPCWLGREGLPLVSLPFRGDLVVTR